MASAAKPGFDGLLPSAASASAPPLRSRRAASPDPLTAVLDLEASALGRRGLAAGLVAALLLHVVAAGAATRFRPEIVDFVVEVRSLLAATPSAEVDVELAPAIDPVPPSPPPLPPETVTPEPTLPSPATPPPEAELPPTPEPPAAAEAGQALTAEPDPTEPLDLTDSAFTLVTGAAQRFPGGASHHDGTERRPVRDGSARGAGPSGAAPPGPAGQPPPPRAPDLSRPAGVLGSTNWNTCPFPAEAELAQVTEARVTLVVSVDVRGRATAASVQAESPSGFGFGARARQCAMARRFEPARDAAGRKVPGQTPPLNVRFTQ